MAALENTIQITPDSLKTSFAKYRKDIIQMPVRALDEAAKFMSRRVGVRGKETVGELAGDMELGPYSLTRKDENGVTITGRTLETFLGSCVKPFEPNAVRESIWGSNVFQGEALKKQPITKLIGMFLACKIGEALFKNLFTMKRNPAGSGTADLADGFKTISDAEIKANAIAVAKGNLFNTTEMTGVNAVDAIEAFYDAADAKLQGINTYMFMNSHELTLYRRCYRDKYGTVNWNNEFNHNKMVQATAPSWVLTTFLRATRSSLLAATCSSVWPPRVTRRTLAWRILLTLTSWLTSSQPCTSVLSSRRFPRSASSSVTTLSL